MLFNQLFEGWWLCLLLTLQSPSTTEIQSRRRVSGGTWWGPGPRKHHWTEGGGNGSHLWKGPWRARFLPLLSLYLQASSAPFSNILLLQTNLVNELNLSDYYFCSIWVHFYSHSQSLAFSSFPTVTTVFFTLGSPRKLVSGSWPLPCSCLPPFVQMFASCFHTYHSHQRQGGPSSHSCCAYLPPHVCSLFSSMECHLSVFTFA